MFSNIEDVLLDAVEQRLRLSLASTTLLLHFLPCWPNQPSRNRTRIRCFGFTPARFSHTGSDLAGEVVWVCFQTIQGGPVHVLKRPHPASNQFCKWRTVLVWTRPQRRPKFSTCPFISVQPPTFLPSDSRLEVWTFVAARSENFYFWCLFASSPNLLTHEAQEKSGILNDINLGD